MSRSSVSPEFLPEGAALLLMKLPVASPEEAEAPAGSSPRRAGDGVHDAIEIAIVGVDVNLRALAGAHA